MQQNCKLVVIMISTQDFLSASLMLGLQFLLCSGLWTDGFSWWKSHDSHELGLRDTTWECTADAECTASDSFCNGGKCQCANGFIYNADRSACLRAATAYGDECIETIQCSTYLFSGGSCINNACECASGYHYLHGRCYPSVGLHEPCRIDAECHVNAEFGAASCIDGICRCSPGFYQREYRTCRRAANKIGDTCMVDVDCRFNPNATCSAAFKCVLPEVDKTRYDILAYIKNNTQKRSVAVRSTDLSQNEGAQYKIGAACAKDSDCASLGNALCHSTGSCVCARAHFPAADGSRCVPELGEPCKDNEKPRISQSVCRDGVWTCKDRMVALKDNRQCRKAVRQYLFSCTRDEQCNVFGPDGECRKKCLCNERSHLVESELFCWTNKRPGEECRHANDCYVEGFAGVLSCSKGVCACPKGTHLNVNGTACLDGQSGLNGACTADADCPKNSSCNGTCVCEDGFVAVSEESCMPLATIGEECESDVQCSTMTSNAVCTATDNAEDESVGTGVTEAPTKLCRCGDGYYLRFGKCYKKRVLGESCASFAECYLEGQTGLAVCRNEVCTCAWGYRQESATRCVRGGRSMETLSINGCRVNTPWITSLAVVPVALQLLRLA